jgi:hypothetical protein
VRKKSRLQRALHFSRIRDREHPIELRGALHENAQNSADLGAKEIELALRKSRGRETREERHARRIEKSREGCTQNIAIARARAHDRRNRIEDERAILEPHRAHRANAIDGLRGRDANPVAPQRPQDLVERAKERVHRFFLHQGGAGSASNV